MSSQSGRRRLETPGTPRWRPAPHHQSANLRLRPPNRQAPPRRRGSAGWPKRAKVSHSSSTLPEGLGKRGSLSGFSGGLGQSVRWGCRSPEVFGEANRLLESAPREILAEPQLPGEREQDLPIAFPANASREQVAHHESDVRGSFCESTHEPWKPLRAVTDEDAYTVAVGCQSKLLGPLDSVEKLEFDLGFGKSQALRVVRDSLNQLQVMGTEGSAGALTCFGGKQPLRQTHVALIHVALARIGDLRRLPVCALYQANPSA